MRHESYNPITTLIEAQHLERTVCLAEKIQQQILMTLMYNNFRLFLSNLADPKEGPKRWKEEALLVTGMVDPETDIIIMVM